MKWREGKAPYTFEQCDRSWVQHKGNPEVEMMLPNIVSPDAKTSSLIVGMGNSHSEVNGRRMLFIKLSRICMTHPCNETEMTSGHEPRETSCKSTGDHDRGSQLNTWNSSKSVTTRDEHRTAREVYNRGKMKLDGGDTDQVMRKAMSTPEGKWFCHPRAACDPQKRPVSRRVSDSGHCEAGAEQKRNVTVPSADSCSWISHRKHGRWKAQ